MTAEPIPSSLSEVHSTAAIGPKNHYDRRKQNPRKKKKREHESRQGDVEDLIDHDHEPDDETDPAVLDEKSDDEDDSGNLDVLI
jgi:hypothetical protein